MDNVAHALCGVALGEVAGTPRLGRRAAWWTGVVSANIADVDAVLRFDDPLRYLFEHRGVTHSLFAAILLPVPIALCARALHAHLMHRTDPRAIVPPLAPYVGLCALGYASHLAFDVVTSWGTMLLAPLSDRRFALDWTFIVDFVFWSLLSCPLWVSRFIPRWSRARVSVVSLVSLALFVACSGILHARVESGAESDAHARGLQVEATRAYPVILSPLRWNVVVRTAGVQHRRVGSVGALASAPAEVSPCDLDDPAVRAVLRTRLGERWLWWSSSPATIVDRTSQPTRVRLIELRYALPEGLRVPFALDAEVREDAGSASVLAASIGGDPVATGWLEPASSTSDGDGRR